MNILSKPFINFVAIVFATVFGASSNSFAATAIFDAGQLTGINQVDVSGSLYDVTFNDSYSGFTYGDTFSLSAAEALTALFLTGGQFSGDPIDLDPTLTSGCINAFICSIGTVATELDNGVQINNIYTFENHWLGLDFADRQASIPTARFITSMDTASDFTYADWTLSNMGAVPIPAAAWLFGTGILGLIGFSKRRKTA